MSDYYAGGIARYTISNLVIASIGAVTTTEITVTCPGVAVGDTGIASPRDAAFTNGLAINPIRVSAANTVKIPIVNASAGAIDAPDTFDFDIIIFKATGNAAAAT
jgi:hypothetical protein